MEKAYICSPLSGNEGWKKDVFAPDPHHFRIFPGADASGTHRYFI